MDSALQQLEANEEKSRGDPIYAVNCILLLKHYIILICKKNLKTVYTFEYNVITSDLGFVNIWCNFDVGFFTLRTRNFSNFAWICLVSMFRVHQNTNIQTNLCLVLTATSSFCILMLFCWLCILACLYLVYMYMLNAFWVNICTSVFFT